MQMNKPIQEDQALIEKLMSMGVSADCIRRQGPDYFRDNPMADDRLLSQPLDDAWRRSSEHKKAPIPYPISDRWVVCKMGPHQRDEGTRAVEVSVVRCDFPHGMQSYWWPCEQKKIILAVDGIFSDAEVKRAVKEAIKLKDSLNKNWKRPSIPRGGWPLASDIFDYVGMDQIKKEHQAAMNRVVTDMIASSSQNNPYGPLY